MKKLYTLLLIFLLSTVAIHATAKTVKHTIKNGETLYSIAHKNHATIKEVRRANSLKKGDILKLGRVLKVPTNTYFPNKKKAKKHIRKFTRSVSYSIKSGDTLSAIALKHHTTVRKIRKANGLKKGKILKLGSVLKVPEITYSPSRKKAIKITKLARKKLGRRYVWGAEGKNVFDCSGLTQYVCKKNGIKLPRRAIAQSKVGKRVNRRNLKKGDLIFFDTSKKRKGYVNHVGIYIGNNKFIHASSAKKKVIITSLSKPFYSQRFKGARRVASQKKL